MFSRFDTVPACDGRTDVQPISITCFSVADARKNEKLRVHCNTLTMGVSFILLAGVQSGSFEHQHCHPLVQCPVLQSSRKVLVDEDSQGPIYKSLSLSLDLIAKSNQIKSTVDLVRLLQLERRRITLSS